MNALDLKPNASISPLRNPAKRNLVTSIAACTALFIALRCVQLDADPPSRINERVTREFFAEPPAKSHEARNYALFGSFKVRAADNYQFWRSQSPVWVYPLAGFFDVFGVDYPQLRVFSTLYAAFGLIVLLVLAAEVMSLPALALVGVMLAVDAVYFHTSRVGLVEPAMSAWLGVCMLALVRAERHLSWLALAFAAFGLAFFTKQGAVFAAPVLGVACLYRLIKVDRSIRAERRKQALVVASAVAVAAFTALYVFALAGDYWRTVSHNVGELVMGKQGPTYNLQSDHYGLANLLLRLGESERHRSFFDSVPISGPLAILTLSGFVLAGSLKRRLPAYRELVIFGWFVSGLVATGLIAKWGLRFWTIVVPPAALIAGLGLDRLQKFLVEKNLGPLAVSPIALTLCVVVGWNVPIHRMLLSKPTYEIRDAALQIRHSIGNKRAAIVGFSSPSIVLGTPYEHYYVKSVFNSQPGRFAELDITHCLFRLAPWDETRGILTVTHPELLPALRHELDIEAFGESLTLYSIDWSKQKPPGPSDGFAYGFALQQVGKLNEAIAVYRQFLQAQPNHAQVRFNLGHALMRTGVYREAISEFERALQLDPRMKAAHFHIATCSHQLGEDDVAALHLANWERDETSYSAASLTKDSPPQNGTPPPASRDLRPAEAQTF